MALTQITRNPIDESFMPIYIHLFLKTESVRTQMFQGNSELFGMNEDLTLCGLLVTAAHPVQGGPQTASQDQPSKDKMDHSQRLIKEGCS